MNKLATTKGNGINVFGFFRDYRDFLVDCLTEDEARIMSFDIVKYVFDDVEPTYEDGKMQTIFNAIKKGLDKSKKLANNARKKEERVTAEPEQREKNQNEIKLKSNQNQIEIKKPNKTAPSSLSLSLSLSNKSLSNIEEGGMGGETLNNAEVEKMVVDGWNKIGLARVQSLSKSRKDKIRLRVKEQGLERVLEAFKHVQQSSFLMGDNKQGWKCSFDWLFTNDTNIVKVLEGNYDDKDRIAKTTSNVFMRSILRDKGRE